MNGRMHFARTLLLLLLLLIPISAFAQSDMVCWYELEDVVAVTVWGYTVTNGQVQWIPLSTTWYYYWTTRCDYYGSIDVYPPDYPYVPTLPAVSVSGVDTTDPDHPLLTANVTYTGNNPPDAVELHLNGMPADYISWSGDGWYQLRMPAIIEIGDGTGTLLVSACNQFGSCGKGAAAIMKSTSTIYATETVDTQWLEGDDWKRGLYGHQYAQVFASTSFNVAEEGQNSRRQLKENFIQLYWKDPLPTPAWSATVTSSGSLRDTSHEAGECGERPTYCSDENCSFKCSWFGNFGLFLSAGDNINWMYNAEKLVHMNFSGGSLQVTIP